MVFASPASSKAGDECGERTWAAATCAFSVVEQLASARDLLSVSVLTRCDGACVLLGTVAVAVVRTSVTFCEDTLG